MHDETGPIARARAAGCPVVDFDIEGDPDFRTHLRDKWIEARELGPIFYSTAADGFWVVSGQEEIHAALANHEAFSSQLMMAFSRRSKDMQMRLIPVTLDPPEHTVYRQLLTPLLGPRAVEAREPEMRAVANELIDAVIAGGTRCDFMRDFAFRFPGRVFGGWLGLDAAEAERYTTLATAQIHYDPTSDPTGSNLIDLMGRLSAQILALVGARRVERRDDIMSQLIDSQIGGRGLTDDELLNIGSLLFLAGFDTTAGAIGEIIWHLATHPEDRRRLAREPGLIPHAIEESLRFYANSGVSGRRVVKDVDVAGCPFKEGDAVFFSLQAADRDPRTFDDPDVMDIDRWPNRHNTFGMGVHRCLGSHLARAEIRISVEEWLRRVTDFELAAGAQVEHMVSITTSPKSLPLVLAGAR